MHHTHAHTHNIEKCSNCRMSPYKSPPTCLVSNTNQLMIVQYKMYYKQVSINVSYMIHLHCIHNNMCIYIYSIYIACRNIKTKTLVCVHALTALILHRGLHYDSDTYTHSPQPQTMLYWIAIGMHGHHAQLVYHMIWRGVATLWTTPVLVFD